MADGRRKRNAIDSFKYLEILRRKLRRKFVMVAMEDDKGVIIKTFRTKISK